MSTMNLRIIYLVDDCRTETIICSEIFIISNYKTAAMGCLECQLFIFHTTMTDACRFVVRQGCQDWLPPAAQKSSSPTEISLRRKHKTVK